MKTKLFDCGKHTKIELTKYTSLSSAKYQLSDIIWIKRGWPIIWDKSLDFIS